MPEEKKKGILGFLTSLADPVSAQKRKEELEQKQRDLVRQMVENGMKLPQTVSDSDKYEFISGQPFLPQVGKSHRIAGLFYREENVMRLAKENLVFKLNKDMLIKKGYTGVKIFKYTFVNEPVELIQEPDNLHDPNAIKVVVANQHIGYIKAGSCAHVNKLINENRIEKIYCRISGGPFKAVYAVDGENPRKKPLYKTEEDEFDLRAEIRIVEK